MSEPGITTPVTIWIDPACPWAWQTARWMLRLESRDLIILNWRLFSLEIANATDPHLPYAQIAPRYGEALTALALARIEAGDRGFRTLYVALGDRLHEWREPMSRDLLVEAAEAADLPGLAERAAANPALPDLVRAEHTAARALDAFGVPTLRIDQQKVFYGPILSMAPDGEDAVEMWEHIRWLAERPELFEMKRWPRDLRPGKPPQSSA